MLSRDASVHDSQSDHHKVCVAKMSMYTFLTAHNLLAQSKLQHQQWRTFSSGDSFPE